MTWARIESPSQNSKVGTPAMNFRFKGCVSSSKSLMNRALIVQSFFPQMKIEGNSQCEDVKHLKKSLSQTSSGSSGTLYCGSGGTSFRFLLARLSRLKGKFTLQARERLFHRPHGGLIQSLNALGVAVDWKSNHCVEVTSQDWDLRGPVWVPLRPSSQFASALLLSSWMLPQTLELKFEREWNDFSYLKMTVEFVKNLGMEIIEKPKSLVIPQGQMPTLYQVPVEADMSSCFVVAAFALSLGQAEILDFPHTSLQPDFLFPHLLQRLSLTPHPESVGPSVATCFCPESLEGPLPHHSHVTYCKNSRIFKVFKSPFLNPLFMNLHKTPDLFPVLAALLVCAQGESQLWGIEDLIYKESNRIQKTLELIQGVGGKGFWKNNKFYIRGGVFNPPPQGVPSPFLFDPDEDHRMTMAATLLKAQGFKIEVAHPETVDKSFPEFRSITSGLL